MIPSRDSLWRGALLAASLLSVVPAQAQEPQAQERQTAEAVSGPEVRLRATGTHVSVAAAGRGGFALAFSDGLRIFAATLPRGAAAPRTPVLVFGPNGRAQLEPEIAADDAGRFVVAWQDGVSSGGGVPTVGGSRVLARSFGAAGAPQGPAVRLSASETGQQLLPSVAVGGGPGFVAGWWENDSGSVRGRIKAARFALGDGRLGPEMELPAGGDFHNNTHVAAYPDGFAVGWNEGFECSGGRPGGNFAAVARFDAEGRRVGSVFRTGSRQCDGEGSAALIALVGSRAGALALLVADGGYVAQRFAPSGVLAGSFRIDRRDCTQELCDTLEAVSMDDSGRVVLVWKKATESFTRFDLSVQLLNARGNPRTARIPVNGTTLEGVQASVALANDGTAVVAWAAVDSAHPDDNGIFLRRFRLP